MLARFSATHSIRAFSRRYCTNNSVANSETVPIYADPSGKSSNDFLTLLCVQSPVVFGASYFLLKKSYDSESLLRFLGFGVGAALFGYGAWSIRVYYTLSRRFAREINLLLPQEVLQVRTLGALPFTTKSFEIPISAVRATAPAALSSLGKHPEFFCWGPGNNLLYLRGAVKNRQLFTQIKMGEYTSAKPTSQ